MITIFLWKFTQCKNPPKYCDEKVKKEEEGMLKIILKYNRTEQKTK